MSLVALSEVAEILSGAGFPTEYQGHSDGDVPFAKVGDISRAKRSEGTTISSAENYVSFDVCKTLNAKIFPEGAIVFAKIGEAIRNGNKVMATRPMTFDNNVMGVVPRQDKILPRYLYRYLDSLDFYSLSNSTTVPSIRKSDMEALSVWLPPLEEQKRIAAILDQADELRRKRQRALDRLNQLGQAIFIEMFGDPSSNPKGFVAKPLGEIIEFVGGSQPAKSHFLYEPGTDRVRFIQIRDFRTDKYPTFVPKALAKRPFSEEDVMIGRYGPPVFQIFRGLSGTYNVALMKAKPRRNLTSDFVFYLLQEPKLHGYVVANSERTAGQSGVNLELLEKYPAYEPPTPLLSAFSERIATLNAELLAARSAAERTDALFASLQHRAFCGQLTASSLKEATA